MPEPATITLLGTGFMAMGVRYLRTKYRAMKPKFDHTVGLVLLILFAPVIGLAALLVKLTSRGPAFYKQERVGEHGRTFNIIKLRTMRWDAETKSGPVWAEAKDSRVILVGGFLRRTHLDELPQLVNVVRGEMSLVGPRPERPYFVQQLRERVPGYDQRLAVKPGITGLAQVRAGYDHALRDVRRKVKLDTMYVQRMCWWVDFIIIIRTMGKFVNSGERRG
jgi:lipopolysaccharide/colanic/teichoic acid biosynthesis glycosyltransferase